MNMYDEIEAGGFANEHEWAAACPCPTCEARREGDGSLHRNVRRFSFDTEAGIEQEWSLGGSATAYDWHAYLRARPDGLWDLTIRKRCPEGDEPHSWETFDPRDGFGSIPRFASRAWARFFVSPTCRVDQVYATEIGSPCIGEGMPRGEVEAAMRDLRAFVASQIRTNRAINAAGREYEPSTEELRREAWQNYMIGEGYGEDY